MKLLYKLSEKEQAVYDKHSTDGEKIMYCLPYNLEDGHFISGHVVITDRFIYRIFEDTLAAKYDFSELSDFSVETLVGSSAFYAKVKGTSTVVCRFLSGRYLSHYTLMVRACKTIAEAVAEGKDPGDPLENDTPELFCDKCGTPLIRGTNICPKCREKGSAFKKLWALTKGMRALLFIPVIVSGISLILQFVLPRIQSSAIDNYLDNELATMANAPAFLMVFALLLGIDILQRALSIAQSRAANVSGTKFVRILRLVVFEKIQSLSLSSIQRHSTGDLMARLNSDVSVTQSFITGTLPSILNQVLSFVIALVILLFVKPILCLFVFIPIIPVCFIARKVWDKFGENSRRLWKDSFEVNCVTQDTIQGERIVKSFGRENSAVEKQHKAINKRTAQAIRSQNYTATMAPIISFLFKLGSYVILFYGNILVFGGDLTLGQLFEYTAYTSVLYAPLTTLLTLPSTLSTVVNSINKVMEILDEEPEIVDIDLPIDIKIEGDIKIDNISFGYNSYDPVLKNISVDIKQGEMIGIVGASGSGKSTLINLIMRMYDVNEGAITIDNVNIKDISQQALRSQMGIVLQETHLFRGSIRDNIAYAKPYATNEEIIRAAKLANAHEFICNLPQGYNTMIGERGFSLSGGERQRVAIARALIHDPRIIILDEATAALDTETEKMIQDSINILMKGRTTLAIAHRLSTLRNADKLIVLDNGRLAEFGTHSELLKLKGIYYKLVMAQRLNAVK